jgi:4-aminobutyrate aminotransferase
MVSPLLCVCVCVRLLSHGAPLLRCQGGTYGGNAVACAAAVATIDVIEKEGLLKNAEERGLQLMKGEKERRHPPRALKHHELKRMG